MVAGGRAATIVGASPGQAERVGRVIVARSANHHAPGRARVRLPVAVGPVRIGAEDADRPLSQVAEHVLDTVRAGAFRLARGRLGRVVGAAEDRQVRRRRRYSPWVGPTVVPAGGLLPLGLGGQGPARPGAGGAGAARATP